MLRETVLGRELFDFAFKEYARRWKFKRPMPADLFRTMEDASGVDLDWFWHGWFYTTAHCDMAIDSVRELSVDTGDPDIEKPLKQEKREAEPETLSEARNRDLPKRADEYPDLKDFYNDFDDLDVTEADRKAFKRFVDGLDDAQRAMLKSKKHFYIVDFSNTGGLMMPIIVELTFDDGSTREERIPAEIWRRNAKKVSRMFITDKEITSLTLDPNLETADVDLANNHFPPKIVKSRFKLYKESKKSRNPMQKARDAKKARSLPTRTRKSQTMNDARNPERPVPTGHLHTTTASRNLFYSHGRTMDSGDRPCRNRFRIPRALSNAALAVALILLAIIAAPQQAFAHPAHLSFAEAEWNAETKRLEVALRVDPSDLEFELRQLAKRKVDLDADREIDSLLKKFLARQFRTREVDGAWKKQIWVGKEIEVKYVWLYFEIPIKPVTDELEFDFRVFVDRVPRQVNTLNVKVASEVKSVNFDKQHPRRTIRLTSKVQLP